MERKTHYGTVSEALTRFKQQGFTLDFNLQENCIDCGDHQFNAEDFEVVDVYRYEGNSDPADEAAVFAIESKTGIKGVLVTGYGTSIDKISTSILKKLR